MLNIYLTPEHTEHTGHMMHLRPHIRVCLYFAVVGVAVRYAWVFSSARHMLMSLPSAVERAPDNNFAIVTVLLGGNKEALGLLDVYVRCLLSIGRRLPGHIKRVTLYDTRLEVVPHVGGWEMVPVAPIAAPHGDTSNQYTSAGVYTKLHVWNLTSYSAVLYLDLDTLPLRSVYPIFGEQLPAMLSVRQSVGMVHDSLNPHDNHSFNAGVMLVVPNAHEFKELVLNIDRIPHDVDGAEQSYLMEFYKGRIFALPSVYNVLNNDKTKAASRWMAIEHQIVILHFVAKPWSFHQCFRDFVEDTCLVWYALLQPNTYV